MGGTILELGQAFGPRVCGISLVTRGSGLTNRREGARFLCSPIEAECYTHEDLSPPGRRFTVHTLAYRYSRTACEVLGFSE